MIGVWIERCDAAGNVLQRRVTIVSDQTCEAQGWVIGAPIRGRQSQTSTRTSE